MAPEESEDDDKKSIFFCLNPKCLSLQRTALMRASYGKDPDTTTDLIGAGIITLALAHINCLTKGHEVQTSLARCVVGMMAFAGDLVSRHVDKLDAEQREACCGECGCEGTKIDMSDMPGGEEVKPS